MSENKMMQFNILRIRKKYSNGKKHRLQKQEAWALGPALSLPAWTVPSATSQGPDFLHQTMVVIDGSELSVDH